jgi:hypothetical protein
MTCHETREWFSGWVDEALTPAERAAVASHLLQCAECRRDLERLTGTIGLLQRLERPRAPAHFADRVLEAARPTPSPRRLWARLFLPLSVKLPAEAAAVLLVAGLAVYAVPRTAPLQQAAYRDLSRPSPPAEVSAPATPGAAAPQSAPGATGRAGLKLQRRVEDEPPRAPLPAAEPSASGTAPLAPPPPPPAKVEAKSTDARPEGAAPLRSSEPVPTASPPRGAPEGRADSARENASRTPAPVAAARSAMRGLSRADVGGRLTVKDRGAAEHALGELLGSLGGVVVSRREEAGTTVMDVTVPRASYPELTQGLARLGSWLPEGEIAELPPQVRVTLRLTE